MVELNLYQLFETDFRYALKIQGTPTLTTPATGEIYTWTTAICQLHEPNAYFLAYYLPKSENLCTNVESILKFIPNVISQSKEIIVNGKSRADFGFTSSLDLTFTGRIFLYIDQVITDSERERISELSKTAALNLVIRDSQYQVEENSWRNPLAFISHDSRDKTIIAKPLAEALFLQRCPVWYDEFSLKIGDNIRQKIEEGIRTCKKCIVILTPNYIENLGWGNKEFESIFAKEIMEKKPR